MTVSRRCFCYGYFVWGSIALLLVGGCSYRGGFLNDLGTSLSIPSVVVLDDTPFFPQSRYQCGPAALATLLKASGINTTAEELKPYVYLPGREGSLRVDVVATTRRYLRIPYELGGSLENLFVELAEGTPVLVMQNLGFSWFPQWHYAVLVGYDLNQQTVMLRSGEIREYEMPIYTFKKTWDRAGRWALIALSRNQLPVSGTGFRYLKAVHEVEKLHPETALAAYRQAVQKWPEEPLLWLALGNLLYQQKHYSESAATLRNALRYHPGHIQLWNNYAYALNAQKCGRASITAIRCAMRIEPRDTALTESLGELMQSDLTNTGQCNAVPSCPVKAEGLTNY